MPSRNVLLHNTRILIKKKKNDKLFFTYQTIDISSILFQRHVRADIMLQETLIVLQSTILSRNIDLSIGGRESDIC